MKSVSVIMPTYNHSSYIAEAIDSFLLQQTSFPCRLYISDDCSTDNTAEVASVYADKFPDKVTLIRKQRNEGLLANYKTLLESSTEDYIAVLESDDYWTDPLKLQKQYDMMESHSDCGLCFSGCCLLKDGNVSKAEDVSQTVDSLNGELYSYLLLRALIWSPTIFFRRESFNRYCSVDEYIKRKFKTFDAPMILSIAANSKICYLKDYTAVYRISSLSISNNLKLRKRLSFESSANDIKAYVISLYGRGGLSYFRILGRECIIYLRIIWRHIWSRR